MGFLNRLVGGRHEESAASDAGSVPVPDSLPSTSAPAVNPELLRDMAPRFSASQPSPTRLYDPYEGIAQAVGGKKAVYQLPEGPEFVFAEEAAVRRRGWGENLQFYTGMGYVGGGSTGFAVGGYQYLRQPLDPSLTSVKLKANRLLNTSGALGKSFGNAAGVLGLYFACFEHLWAEYSDKRIPEAANTMAAGFCTAALYRLPRGPRLAGVAGVVGAVAAGGLAVARQFNPSL